MNKEELAREIFASSYLTGNFMLRSGVYSSEYFDKYRFESNPSILRAIASEFAKVLPGPIQLLAGMELGGIPLATALSMETGLPCLFVRKEAKSHGTQKSIEGVDFEGKTVCLVEDVVTTGGQIVDGINAIRDNGGTVEHALCVILRTGKVVQSLEQHGVRLHYLFTMQDLKQFVEKG
ncbi:MAG: orotate phosphoribosyltransferase [Saprospirales bacterium]|nr:orotate phosphoribosyltransferase [Saprospirales bacterium]